MRKVILYALLFFCSAGNLFSQSSSERTISAWKFRQLGTRDWHDCSVPGNVVTDLYQNKLIPDPFYSDNEKKLQWIENERWEYQTAIVCDKRVLLNGHLELVFEGLDTYANVYLNDSLVLSTDNMFRCWNVEVKNLLKEGANTLRIVFESAVKKGNEAAGRLPYALPEGARVFSRKAQFQYGWDFGPRYAACGIWKPVRLLAWNNVKIESLHYVLESISDSLARVNFIVNTRADRDGNYTAILGQQRSQRIKVPAARTGKALHLKAGRNKDTIAVAISGPKRWWSNGLGEAYLYKYLLTLYQGEEEITQQSLTVGLRTIELVNENDSSGRSFYFKLNGKPVFAKGANYIPDDIFLRPKTKQAYLQELEDCKKVHMNMLRVWGGGVYGDDAFYEACDENGILVWQDFMFACAMYPGDTGFFSNIKAEVTDQVRRLRNHPSLALWCGNNENSEGWFNWGWQKQLHYTAKDSLYIWTDYQKLFRDIIPTGIRANDERPYWESSPSIGWGRKESLRSGDAHYWGIWWGMEPFSTYEKKVGRFMSEYGFQGMPALETFNTFCKEEELDFHSDAVKAHQKHKTGYETIQVYLERAYKTPEKFRDYIYVSQLLQRDGMATAIAAHRANKPFCMGTLFWQLNDCWPGTSWSALDYFKRPKAFYYALDRLFKTEFMSVSENSDAYLIHCVNDSIKSFEAILVLKILNFKSGLIWEKEVPVNLSHEKASAVVVNKRDLPVFDSSSCYMKTELRASRKTLASTLYFFAKPKNLTLPKTTINIVRIDSETFEISSPVFAKDVFLYDEGLHASFDHNFFDLEAGEKKKVKLLDAKNKGQIQLKSIVLNTVYE